MSAELLNAGSIAMQRGQLAEAAAHFDQAARTFLAANDHGGAFNALTNLAMVNKLTGDLQGAYGAVIAALQLEGVPKNQRALATMTKASILDALDNLNAIAAWAECVTLFEDPPTIAFCLSHAAGVLMKHGDLGAVVQVKQAIEHAGTPTSSQLAGIIGAGGESAGKNGAPLLAQAVLVLRQHLDAWNSSTAPFWDLLVDRVGPATPVALSLCSFGLIATSMQKATPDYPILMSRVGAVLDRVARARGITVDRVLDAIQSDPNLFVELEATLRALVPADQWVIGPPR